MKDVLMQSLAYIDAADVEDVGKPTVVRPFALTPKIPERAYTAEQYQSWEGSMNVILVAHMNTRRDSVHMIFTFHPHLTEKRHEVSRCFARAVP